MPVSLYKTVPPYELPLYIRNQPHYPPWFAMPNSPVCPPINCTETILTDSKILKPPKMAVKIRYTPARCSLAYLYP